MPALQISTAPCPAEARDRLFYQPAAILFARDVRRFVDGLRPSGSQIFGDGAELVFRPGAHDDPGPSRSELVRQRVTDSGRCSGNDDCFVLEVHAFVSFDCVSGAAVIRSSLRFRVGTGRAGPFSSFVSGPPSVPMRNPRCVATVTLFAVQAPLQRLISGAARPAGLWKFISAAGRAAASSPISSTGRKPRKTPRCNAGTARPPRRT